MITRIIDLQLRGFGAPPATARAEIAELSPADRLKRAAVVFGAFIAVAVIALPIPIVHFVLVPAGLLLAITLGAWRLGESVIFRGVEGRCPLCGAEQQFHLMGRFRVPRALDCEHCRRRLTLEAREG
ncbi:MAG TPA: hypothetical protein VFN40_04530 [Gemmatimonadales bacterium]|nr:hypothetical protein [Gemmatimonadales bacterium]